MSSLASFNWLEEEMEEHNNRRYYRDDMLEEEVIMARKTGYAATSVMNENEIILYSHP